MSTGLRVWLVASAVALLGGLLPPAAAQTTDGGLIPIDPAPAGTASPLDGDPATTERVLERDPVLNAVAVSRLRFADAGGPGRTAAHVVLSRDDEFADSLAGSVLTGEGPLLLTARDGLPGDTAAEIDRVLGAGGTVYLLGGTQAISAEVEQRLRDDGYATVRLAGATRVETALAVADEARARYGRDEVLVARAYGSDADPTAAWADAVSAGALAAASGVPIVVTPTEQLHPRLAAWVDTADPSLVVLLGGTAALSPAVADALPDAVRVAGPERAATAAAIAAELWGASTDGPRSFVVVAGHRADGWAFGLAGAGLAADARVPALLVAGQVPAALRPLVGTCGAPETDLLLVGDGSIISGRLRELLDAYDGQACEPDGSVAFEATLQQIADCTDLLGYLTEHGLERVGPYGLEGVPVPVAVAEPVDGEEGAAEPTPAPAPEEDAASGEPVSGTNVQEQGVDEPDLVKTDGEIAIAVARGRLQVVDLTGDAPRLAATLDLPGGFDHELLLSGDRALVLTRQDFAFIEPVPGPEPQPIEAEPASTDAIAPYPEDATPTTTLTLLDVADPDAPQVLGTLEMDGSYRSARMIGSVARVVVQSDPAGLDFAYPTDGSAEAERAALEHNQQVILDATVEDWLPQSTVTTADGQSAAAPLLDCADVQRPPWFAGFGTVNVVTVDLAGAPEPTSSAAVLARGDTVYASPQSLYVATSRWNSWEPTLVGEPVTTELHRFDISDPAATGYRSSGSVPGFLLNQFSLSEHADHLRVATTELPPWEEGGPDAVSVSSVRVLTEQGGELVQVGVAGGLGANERIFAVRFVGDLGFVVTFRQVDPLFVLDLSDPTAPRVTGELHIPGYSAYLHPVGDGLLLGVGQDADEEGRLLGAQISLFDVSDVTAPQRVDQVVFGPGFSEVEFDHRAFLYWPPAALAVLPLELYEDGFTGAAGVRVDGSARTLTEAGRIAHPDDSGYYPAVRRSFVVGDTLYTVSDVGLEAASLADLGEQSFLRFE